MLTGMSHSGNCFCILLPSCLELFGEGILPLHLWNIVTQEMLFQDKYINIHGFNLIITTIKSGVSEATGKGFRTDTPP